MKFAMETADLKFIMSKIAPVIDPNAANDNAFLCWELRKAESGTVDITVSAHNGYTLIVHKFIGSLYDGPENAKLYIPRVAIPANTNIKAQCLISISDDGRDVTFDFLTTKSVVRLYVPGNGTQPFDWHDVINDAIPDRQISFKSTDLINAIKPFTTTKKQIITLNLYDDYRHPNIITSSKDGAAIICAVSSAYDHIGDDNNDVLSRLREH